MHTHTYKIYIPKNFVCMLVGIQTRFGIAQNHFKSVWF